MKLYHFTEASNVLPIKERGLLPGCDEATSPEHPVVWLTKQRKPIDGRVQPEDDVMRLTVDVPDDGRLFRYVTWPDRPLKATCSQPYVRLWYVYLGSIAPQMITEVLPV
jgi:hypothetical protein